MDYSKAFQDQQSNIALLDRLTVWLDEGIAEEPTHLFDSAISVRTPGGEAQGFEAAVAQARRTHAAGEVNQHLATNPVVTVEGDAAKLRANFMVAFGPLDMKGPARTMGGLYELATVRTAAGWRIRSLAVKPLWRAGDWGQARVTPEHSAA